MNGKLKNYGLLAISACVLIGYGCSSPIKTAEQEYARGDFDNAVVHYKKALEKDKKVKLDRSDINFRIAESYRKSNRLDQAEPYYQAAKEAGNNSDSLKFFYAQSLKRNAKYEQAQKAFETYASSGVNAGFKQIAKNEAAHLANVNKTLGEKSPAKIKNCDQLNTDAAEYAPFLHEGKLYFTSSRNSKKIYEATGAGFLDIFVMTFTDEANCQGNIEDFHKEINEEKHHDANPAFSPDGKVMVFARSNSGAKKDEITDVNLMFAIKQGDAWSEPKHLPFCNKKTWDSTPSFGPDGTLYFASSRQEGSQGGVDIYKVRFENGQWTQPVNLGPTVNTSGNEMFPYVRKDGTLFIASDGHPGFGGLDLFEMGKEGAYKAKNMGKPLNSEADDFAVFFKDDRNGYFASNRTGDMAKGDDDIYSFEIPEPVRLVEYYLEGVVSFEGKPVAGAVVKLFDGETLLEQITADANGKFRFDPQVYPDKNYKLEVGKQSYHDYATNYSTAGKGVDMKTLTQDLTQIVWDVLIPLTKPEDPGTPEIIETIVLEHIYYVFDKWDITDQAAVELDKLVDFMKKHPHYKIEFGSHTDERGSVTYNQTLSQKRAESAVKYVVSKGIDSERIVAKGYGKSTPKIKNAKTDEEHAQNRRTTITVLDAHFKEGDKKVNVIVND